MKLNNKAQNITQIYTIILILSLISLFSGVWFYFGQDLAGDSSSGINDVSRAYIYNVSGFSYEKITAEDTDSIYYSSETGSEGNLKDYAYEFQFYREKSSGFRGWFQMIYGAPKFFLNMFQIPLNGAWADVVIPVFDGIIWVIIFYLVYRIIRGLIR